MMPQNADDFPSCYNDEEKALLKGSFMEVDIKARSDLI